MPARAGRCSSAARRASARPRCSSTRRQLAAGFRLLRRDGDRVRGRAAVRDPAPAPAAAPDRASQGSPSRRRARSRRARPRPEREVDRFLIGVGVLTLLADAAEERPLLALLDDAAWFDRESADALGFAPVDCTPRVSCCSSPSATSRVRTSRCPASRAARRAPGGRRRARAARATGVDGARRDAVVERARGNPLALLELARPDGARRGRRRGGLRAAGRGAPGAHAGAVADRGRRHHRSLAVVGGGGRGARARRCRAGARRVGRARARGRRQHRVPASARAVRRVQLGALRRPGPRAPGAGSRAERRQQRRSPRLASRRGRPRCRRGRRRRPWRGPRAGRSSARATRPPPRRSSGPASSHRTRRIAAAASSAPPAEAVFAGERGRALGILDRAGAVTDPALVAVRRDHARLGRDRRRRHDRRRSSGSCARSGRAAPRRQRWRCRPPCGRPRAPARRGCRSGSPSCGRWSRTCRAPTTSARRSRSRRASARSPRRTSTPTFPALARAAELAEGSSDPLTLLHSTWAAAFAGDPLTAARLAARAEQLARGRGAMAPLAAILMSRATWELGAARFPAARGGGHRGPRAGARDAPGWARRDLTRPARARRRGPRPRGRVPRARLRGAGDGGRAW